MARCSTLMAAILVLTLPAGAAAQLEISGRAATLTIGGLVQPQYGLSSIEGADNDFVVRRARLRAEVMVNDFVGGRVLTEFGGGSGRLLDAYMMLDFSERFSISAGQFKRAFDLFELPSPADLPEIDRSGGIEGYSPCPEVGSICSHTRLTERLAFAGRDIGVRVGGAVGEVSYLATVTNGTGLNTSDENDSKSASARVSYAVREDLVVSGQLGLHDYVDPDGNAKAFAFGGDVDYGTWRDGLHLRGSLVAGDNWLDLEAAMLDAATFLTFQAIGTYYFPMDHERLDGIEPLARVSFGDPNTEADDDGGILVTPGIMFYVTGRNRIGANLDIYSPQAGDKEFSFQIETTLYF